MYDENELRRLLAMGMRPEDIASITDLGNGGENALASLLQNGQQMPQPNFDIAPMQPNTMRTENGPDQGKVVPLDFTAQKLYDQGRQAFDQSKQPPQEKLGDRVDFMGKVGRYSQDGREKSSSRMAPARRPIPTLLSSVRSATSRSSNRSRIFSKGEAEIAHQNEVTAGLSAQRNVREDPTTQPSLEKRFGKPPKDMQWTPEGRAIPIPGSQTDLQGASTIDSGADALRKIDELIGKRDANGQLVAGAKPHPGFESAVGISGIDSAFGLAGLLPGTDTTDFKRRLDELKGGAFLQAYNTLKGGGAITEVEGKKATDAITRMDKSQSENEFVKAAMDFRDVISRGMDRASQMRAGQPTATAQPSSRQSLSTPPNAAQNAGKIMTDSTTGIRYKSDGQRWVRLA
jgi:hypothetical protein